jgi:NAD+ synthase
MTMNELPQIDAWRVEKFLSEFIREYTEKAGKEKVILGISGGIDSALVAALAREALGPRRVVGLILPYHSTPPEEARDAEHLCRMLKIRHKTIEITPMVDAYFSHFPRASLMRRGNKMARERMSILYDWAAYHDALVLGTSNRTELTLGYFTKFGDGGADLEPIGGLYKCEVRQLGHSLSLPRMILDKPPSAGFWKGQTDEKELGFSYNLLDRFLHLHLDKGFTPDQLVESGFPPETVVAVVRRIRANRHKLLFPPSAEIPAQWRK